MKGCVRENPGVCEERGRGGGVEASLWDIDGRRRGCAAGLRDGS